MQTYTIREISQMFSLPYSTLRYYESVGILVSVQKTPSGHRIYTQEHIDRLKCINCFKRAGMTISQLQTLFEYETDEAGHIDEIIELLEEQEAQVNKQLTQLQADFRHVHHKVEYYKQIKKALESGEPRPTCSDCEE